jgi:hypothetical protein
MYGFYGIVQALKKRVLAAKRTAHTFFVERDMRVCVVKPSCTRP